MDMVCWGWVGMYSLLRGRIRIFRFAGRFASFEYWFSLPQASASRYAGTVYLCSTGRDECILASEKDKKGFKIPDGVLSVLLHVGDG